MQMRTVNVEVIGSKKSNDRGPFHAIKLVEPVDGTVFWHYVEPDSKDLNQLRECKSAAHLINIWVENGKVKNWEPAVTPAGKGSAMQLQSGAQLSEEDRYNQIADYVKHSAVLMAETWHAVCDAVGETQLPVEELAKMTMTIYIDTRKRFG